MFNAIELFSIARTDAECRAVERAMSAVKILGMNVRNAKKYGRWVAGAMKLQKMNAIVAGICLEGKLPILTDQPGEFKGVTELVIVPPHHRL